LSTLRVEGREFFRFSAPEKAINRVSSILTQLGELDANGETAPAKERLEKQEKELKNEQKRRDEIKAANKAWSSQREKNEELALSKVESRLGYSIVSAKRELEDANSHFDRFHFNITFKMPLAIFVLILVGGLTELIIPPVALVQILLPFFIIRYFIMKKYRKKLAERSAKVDVVRSEVYKLMSQMKDRQR
jgi:Flp pilus assembly protein TadB